MNGELLTMTKGETELEMVPYVPAGELLVLWQLHREGLGNTVEITTGETALLPSGALLLWRLPRRQQTAAFYGC